jgi:hypothetical protein
MSVETYPKQTTEPESFSFPVLLQGQGAVAPTVTVGKGVTVARGTAGVYTLTFANNPGPAAASFLGGAAGFGNATATVVLGWTVCFGAYTAATATGVKATLKITVGNSSFAAADLATTSTLGLTLTFKMARSTE